MQEIMSKLFSEDTSIFTMHLKNCFKETSNHPNMQNKKSFGEVTWCTEKISTYISYNHASKLMSDVSSILSIILQL